MADETIGGVSVSISGDTTQLRADFATAQAAAATAGAQVASAFSAGAGSVDGLTEATTAAAVAEEEFAASTEVANTALGHQVTQVQAASAAIRVGLGEQSIRAVERLLVMIPGLGAALQYAFPVLGAIALSEAVGRVAEKFIGLKEAEQELKRSQQEVDAAFDKTTASIERTQAELQALALGAASGKKIEAFYSQQSADEDRDRVKALSGEIQELVRQHGQFQLISMIPFLGADAMKAQEDVIKAKQNEQQKLLADAQTKDNETTLKNAQIKKDLAEQAGALAAARISNEEQANAKLGQMARAVADQQIFAVRNTAAEEVRVATEKEAALTGILERELPKRISLIRQQGAAEAQGKTAPEQARIGVSTAGKVAEAEASAAKEAFDAHAAVLTATRKAEQDAANQSRDAWERAYDAIKNAGDETAAAQAKATEAAILTQSKVAEIEAKGKGKTDALVIAAQKLALERAYGLEIGHNGEAQIAYKIKLAAYDSKERAAQLSGLQSELKIAEAMGDEDRRVVEVARIEQEIAVLKQKNLNAAQAENNAIDEANQKLTQQLSLEQQISAAKAAAQNTAQANQQQIGQQLGNAIGNLPKEVGDDIGNSIANALLGHHPGESIGHAMAKALADSLKQTLMKMLSGIISSGVQFGLGFLGGFADGGSPPIGVPSIVGERGPEIFVPREAGAIVPNHAIKGYAEGAGFAYGGVGPSSTSVGDLHFHAHGMSDPNKFIDHVMRELPKAIKARSAQFSPYAR